MTSVIEKGKKIKECKEWKNFKAKWDRNIPRKGTNLFKEYEYDVKNIQDVIDNL